MVDVARGAYEQLVTREWDERLRPVDPELVQRTSLHPADAHEALTRHIAALAPPASGTVSSALRQCQRRGKATLPRNTLCCHQHAVEVGLGVSQVQR